MDPLIQNNEAANQFELTTSGHTAFLQYRLQPDSIVLLHTEVPDELEGQGIGKKLAIAAFDYSRQNALKIVPLCPFISVYIKRHPEYLNLVHEDYRDRLAR